MATRKRNRKRVTRRYRARGGAMTDGAFSLAMSRLTGLRKNNRINEEYQRQVAFIDSEYPRLFDEHLFYKGLYAEALTVVSGLSQSEKYRELVEKARDIIGKAERWIDRKVALETA
jgi:hypothetical protein